MLSMRNVPRFGIHKGFQKISAVSLRYTHAGFRNTGGMIHFGFTRSSRLEMWATELITTSAGPSETFRGSEVSQPSSASGRSHPSNCLEPRNEKTKLFQKSGRSWGTRYHPPGRARRETIKFFSRVFVIAKIWTFVYLHTKRKLWTPEDWYLIVSTVVDHVQGSKQ